jgi:cytochrome c oxidase subunit 4
MEPTNLTYDQQQHVESHVPYFSVGVVLFIFTVIEYCYASFLPGLSFFTLVLGLMVLAMTKASMVAWFFMHLKFEGNWVYFLLVPAGFLVLVFLTFLYPDIGAQKSAWPEEEEEVMTAPLEPAGATRLRA